MRWLLWCFCLLAESYETINHYHYQFLQAKSLMQHSVGFSFASQSFSIAVNIGGKLQWTGFASTYRNQQNKF